MLALPAKVFEYVRFDSWLLALAEPGSAIAQVLEGTSADVVVPEVDAIAAAIVRRYRDHRAGNSPGARCARRSLQPRGTGTHPPRRDRATPPVAHLT